MEDYNDIRYTESKEAIRQKKVEDMRRWIRRFGLLLICIMICAGSGMLFRGYQDCRAALEDMSLEEMGGKIKAQENYTELNELPQDYLNAVLAVEDKRFYRHPGIDPIAIGRALYHDILAGAYVEGGSTITQQLAKNQYFTQEKKISRKLAEMFMAFEIEKYYDKDTILELYLNSICFGNGYDCVAEASMGYFGKLPGEMNFDESTLLAGIPNAPSVYNPLINPELARQRQKQVLEKMEKAGFLNK